MSCRHPLISRAIAAVAVASLLAAGCGASSSTSATTGLNKLLAYSDCMRSHGVQNFPDPTISEGIPKDPSWIFNPKTNSASKACQHLMPATGLGPPQSAPRTATRLAAALSFARCVRARGFPNFPDPTVQGQLTPEMVSSAGIELHQPALLHAGLACAPMTHGLITRAAVERAVKGG
jgi:hypothetical protein